MEWCHLHPGSLSSVKPSWTHLHRHVQRRVSKVILNLVKLTVDQPLYPHLIALKETMARSSEEAVTVT